MRDSAKKLIKLKKVKNRVYRAYKVKIRISMSFTYSLHGEIGILGHIV